MDLDAFALAIETLSLEGCWQEVHRLENSNSHLEGSNEQMRTFVQDLQPTHADHIEMTAYIKENEAIMTTQLTKIKMLKDHISLLHSTENGVTL